MKTQETLVRRVLVSSPCGEAVVITERIDVEVEWPDARPERDLSAFITGGNWMILEGAVSFGDTK